MKQIFEPDLTTVTRWDDYLREISDEREATKSMYQDAQDFLTFYDWCVRIREGYVGIVCTGIIGLFLFHIEAAREEVDEWIWVIVGDLPPAYLTCELCPNPATALDGYIGAMETWVEAAERGDTVADLVPVNVPANAESARALKSRLKLLDEHFLNALWRN